MLKTRVIPCLLLRNRGLVKTVRFKNPKYLGDPVNIVRIFNEKEVDEIVLLDITAAGGARKPPFSFLSEIVSEAFMPVAYGGGVRTIEDMEALFSLGVEKVSINTHAVEDPGFIGRAAERFGSQSVVAAMDVSALGRGRYEVVTHGGTRRTGLDPVRLAARMEEVGAGELFVNSVDRDGTMEGYDLELIRRVCDAVRVPVIACGGAGRLEDFAAAAAGGASAVAAGSLFVFQGPHRAVLISYPSQRELQCVLS